MLHSQNKRKPRIPSASEKYCKCKEITKEIFSCKTVFFTKLCTSFFCLLKSWAGFFCNATHKAHNITVYCVYQAATKCHISCAREHRGEEGTESEREIGNYELLHWHCPKHKNNGTGYVNVNGAGNDRKMGLLRTVELQLQLQLQQLQLHCSVYEDRWHRYASVANNTHFALNGTLGTNLACSFVYATATATVAVGVVERTTTTIAIVVGLLAQNKLQFYRI